jgi:ATP-dependent Zn protease
MLEAISKELLDKETIDEQEFAQIMERVKNSRNFS